MSLAVIKDIRDSLIQNSDLTNLVTSENIQVGWKRELQDFPCIIITQSSGVDTGYLGYSTSPSGSRTSKEQTSFQIDIYSRKSLKETYDILDVMKKILKKKGYSKTSDNDTWVEDYKAYRKITTWRYVYVYDE